MKTFSPVLIRLFLKSQLKIVALCSMLCLVALGLSSCNRYSVAINEKTIYTPKTLFTQYSIADAHLHTCLANTIAEKRLTQAEQLQQLFCPGGGIQKLTGMEVFTELRHLGLADNRISDISALSQLKKLEQIDLSGNTITEFAALLMLPSLKSLNAERNAQAHCSALQKLASTVSVEHPSHCNEAK